MEIDAASEPPSAMGRYRLEFLPAIVDEAGNSLNNGVAPQYDFNVIHGMRIFSCLPQR